MDQIRQGSGNQVNYSSRRNRGYQEDSVSGQYQAKDVADVNQMGYSNDVEKLNKELGLVTRQIAQYSDALERITARLAEATEGSSQPKEPVEGPVR